MSSAIPASSTSQATALYPRSPRSPRLSSSRSRQLRRNRIVKILNPAPDGSPYTTRRIALELERRGRAILVDSSGIVTPSGAFLFLLDIAHLDNAAARKARIELSEDEAITRDRKGIFYWNGADHSRNASHRPFENVVLAKPGRVGTIAWINHQLDPVSSPAARTVGSKAIQARRTTHFPDHHLKVSK